MPFLECLIHGIHILILVPHLQIRANSLVNFAINEDRSYSGRSIQALLSANIQKERIDEETGEIIKYSFGTYNGKLSVGGKKRLSKAIDFLIQVVDHKGPQVVFNKYSGKNQRFKVNFITLTMPPDILMDARSGHKKLLEPFLQWHRRKNGCRSYVWKAELQQNGQLHYHVISDAWVDCKDLQRRWNGLLKRNGLLDGYFSRYGNWDAPSTDVGHCKKMNGVAGYLEKEIAKNFQNGDTVGGKVWDCSTNLKVAKFFTINENINQAWVRSEEKKGNLRSIITDHCSIYRLIAPAHSVLNETQLLEYKQYMDKISRIDAIPRKNNRRKVKDIQKQTFIPLTCSKNEQNEQTLFSFFMREPITFDIDIGCFSSS